MSVPLSSTSVASAAEQLRELQERIHLLQGRRNREVSYPLLPAFSPLLPDGLRAGAVYSVEAPLSVAMALLAGPSSQGHWCGVAGVPDFGAEAAKGFGISLERTVLVPDPGDRWLVTASALADVLPLLLVRPPARPGAGDASRLSSRLRERGCTLLVLGPWLQAEGVLGVEGSRWDGLGEGHGHLRSHRMNLVWSQRGTRRRTGIDLAALHADPTPWGEATPAGGLP
ncbi:hypothetical protein [Sinomonas susongensis]|uniref:hypothetical protein n=1 Tax=Sinomonas susongensis TaxID=1324851 RepID=UPI001FEB6AEF|nr:hypothetical protein [Sinomonas susongensis]